MTALLRHPVVIRIAQLAIGLLFLAASLSKIADLPAFALQVQHYRLLPLAAVNPLAITLPWIELIAGLALVLGVRPRSGAWITLALMVVFTFAVGAALARGLDFECGCFGTVDAAHIGLAKMLQNVGMLALAAVASLERR
jgi:uncharacterized membrane protein YphA (DoxX/SURF4 family)